MKRLYPNQPLVSVGVVMIFNGKILLEKRKKAPSKGKWSIPGGLVELGESLEQAVTREVREETNLKVEQPELIDVVDNIIVDERDRVRYHFMMVDYSLKLKHGEFRAADDASELEWVELYEVEKYDLSKRFRCFSRKIGRN